MILEKVKEIKKVEENAAEKKSGVQIQVKKMISEAEEQGEKFLADTENKLIEESKKIISDSERKAAEIISKAENDSKIEAVAYKVEAELNISTAVKMIIDEIIKEYEQ